MSAPAASGPAKSTRFGPFECNWASGELWKNGIRIHLADQPFRLLEILLERPGEIVTRQALGERLWAAGTYVDFDDSLNTAVNKLRAALDDRADSPRYIETVPRRGYRFIGELRSAGAAGTGAAAEEAGLRKANSRLQHWPIAAAGIAGAIALWYGTPLPPPQIVSVDQITTSSRIDTPVRPVSDGARVFYIERNGGHWDLMQTSVRGGGAQKVANPGPSAVALDVSAATGQLLLGTFTARDQGQQLWTMPLQGGAAVPLGGGRIGGAVFSPDGRRIASIYENALWIRNADGTAARRVAGLPAGSSWPAWSPDGSRLRFSVGRDALSSIWEVALAGGAPHRLDLHTPSGDECCGDWTADGRYFVFTVWAPPHPDLWALRERGSRWRRSPAGPFQLTHGPTAPVYGTPGPDGEVFFYNGIGHSQIERVNPATGEATPAASPIAPDAAYSRDRQWIAYPDPATRALVRSRGDGTEKSVLAGGQYNPGFPRWSPDGKWIAFIGERLGQPGGVYFVATAGGEPQPLLPLAAGLQDVDWSPRGDRLVTSEAEGKDAGRELALVDFASRQTTRIPGSQGLAAARWSPDGRYISATAIDQTQLKLYDLERRQWRVIATGTGLGIAEWSPDSRYLYFQDILAAGEPLMRLVVGSGKTERVAEFSAVLASGAFRCGFFGVDPAGEPILRYDRTDQDLFAATVTWP